MASTLQTTKDRRTLAARLAEARSRTDEIFSILDPEALYERPVPERHRLIFYLGHVEAFDWNLIARRAFGVEPFHEEFDRLFAFGIDPTDGGLPNEPATDWPRPDAVRAYNGRTRAIVDRCALGELEAAKRGRANGDSGEDAADGSVFEMAIEHRLMHAETLAYLLHQLPYRSKKGPGPDAPPLPRPDGLDSGPIVRVPSGRATLGKVRNGGSFGWDNEFETHTVEVPEFAIDAHKVTNGRFLDFVRDGGYEKRDLWAPADWIWREKQGVRHPLFWVENKGEWRYRGMFEEHPLPLETPVYVSHAEASAFARWSGRSLPSEPEFHRAAYGTPDGGEREFPWGEEAPGPRHGNFDFRRWDPTPVGRFPDGASAFGVHELVGNGWEWTGTVFAPFPGFRPHPDYEGYSSNFFDGEHYVLKGGSPRTASCMLRRSFRNWFQPRYPYTYAGFRLVDR